MHIRYLSITICLLACATLAQSACNVTYPGAADMISRLSPDDTIRALNFLEEHELPAFFDLTDIPTVSLTSENVTALKCSIQYVLLAHFNRQSWFMKMLNLLTFYNIVSVLAVFTFAVFLLLLTKDIAFFVTFYVGSFIIKLLFSGRALKIGGVVCSIILLGFKTAPCRWVRYMFFFDEYTPLLGLLIFAGTSWYVGADILDSLKNNENRRTQRHMRHVQYTVVPSDEQALAWLMILWIIVGTVTTLYHNHWILGVVTVLVLFGRCGFFAKSMRGGYEVGFENSNGLVNCLVAATILVPGFITIRLNVPVLYETVEVFETGVLFWGTLIGLLALLIISDYNYVHWHLKASAGVFLWLQVLMFTTCLGGMYFGSILDISSLRTLGGTYLVLWAIDLQRVVLSEFKEISLTPLFFIGFINLAILRYWIQNYPQYFIIG